VTPQALGDFLHRRKAAVQGPGASRLEELPRPCRGRMLPSAVRCWPISPEHLRHAAANGFRIQQLPPIRLIHTGNGASRIPPRFYRQILLRSLFTRHGRRCSRTCLPVRCLDVGG
jgi:hypothetical protein